jgi:hypothetical protein
MELSSPRMWDTFAIFKQLLKVSNRPLGENLPDLVTLAFAQKMYVWLKKSPGLCTYVHLFC